MKTKKVKELVVGDIIEDTSKFPSKILSIEPTPVIVSREVSTHYFVFIESNVSNVITFYDENKEVKVYDKADMSFDDAVDLSNKLLEDQAINE
jgi:hypothetical protein